MTALRHPHASPARARKRGDGADPLSGGVGAVRCGTRSFQRIPVRTAWAACPTPAMLVRDRRDVLFEDKEFAGLYPKDRRPGWPGC